MIPPQDGEDDFAAMLAEFDQKQTKSRGPEIGDMIKGRILSIGDEAVFIDVGGKAEAMLDREQVVDRDGKLAVAVGDIIEARVVDLGSKTGFIHLRRVMAKGIEAKGELVQAFEHQIPVEGLVSGVIKGGVEVQVAGVRAFCPVSQLELRFVEDPSVFIGQRLQFRITRLEAGRGANLNLVLSRRALLAEEAETRAGELRKHLEVGAVLPGTVTTIKDYGAFIDLGGIEGMLHVSELGFQRVGHPSEVLHVGQTVQVQVTKMEKTDDPKRPERLSLSLKSLEKDPWADLADQFREGTRVRGKVVRLQPFGAFIEVAPGIEGLVHVSEMAEGRRINHPRELLEVGREVEVIVVGVDPVRHRMSLSMSAKSGEEAAAEAADFAAVKASGARSLGTFGDLLKKSRPKS